MATNLGLVGFRSATALQEDERMAEEAAEQRRRMEAVETSLASKIRKDYQAAKESKRAVEDRLLDCARRQRGQYSSDKLAQIREAGGSEVYPKITTTKVRAAAAWIRDVLMPANGKAPFGLEPTPLSDIPPEYLQQFMQRMSQEMPDVTAERAEAMLREKVEEVAKRTAERHEELIQDQMAEGGWHKALEQFIDDFATYPTAIMRGPTLMLVPELKWLEGWELIEDVAIKPTWKRVSPFDFYPSGDAEDPDTCAYVIEREPYRRQTLAKLRGVPGYSTEAIDAVLFEHGNGGLRSWEAVDSQRAKVEDKEFDYTNNRGETIEGLHYWGSAQGLMLLQWGMVPSEIPDPLDEYEIDAILIGRHVVRCVINKNPMGRRPYGVASFQNVPGSIWGTAIPELMADIQDMCCAVARAQANNTAFASGPQIDVNIDRLAPDENPNEIFPLKRWRTKSDRATNGQDSPAIRFYQPNSQAGELMAVYDNWEKRADDATNIPRYAYGNEQVGGAGSTMGGLAMLMESANKGIKDAIRHVDRGVISKNVEAMWLHNMRYSSDNSIKGDCKAIPRGASAMLMKEQVQQARQQFLATTANELDMSILGLSGRAALLRTVADELDMPGLVPSEEDLDAREEQQQKAQAEQQQMVQQMEQMKLQLEQAKHQLEEMEVQANVDKVEAENEETRAEAEKKVAETQRILLEIRSLMAGFGDQNAQQPRPQQLNGAAKPATRQRPAVAHSGPTVEG